VEKEEERGKITPFEKKTPDRKKKKEDTHIHRKNILAGLQGKGAKSHKKSSEGKEGSHISPRDGQEKNRADERGKTAISSCPLLREREHPESAEERRLMQTRSTKKMENPAVPQGVGKRALTVYYKGGEGHKIWNEWRFRSKRKKSLNKNHGVRKTGNPG